MENEKKNAQFPMSNGTSCRRWCRFFLATTPLVYQTAFSLVLHAPLRLPKHKYHSSIGHQTGMTSTSNDLTELRRKRLVALGVLPKPPTSSVGADLAKKRSVAEVIDLVDDDDEVEVTKPPSRAKLPPASLKTKEEATGSPTAKPTRKRAKGPPRRIDFQVATWNVWFGDGDGNPNPSARMKQVCRELHKSSPRLWFIGFQEVVDELWSNLQPALSMSYNLFRQENCPYGCAIAVRKSVQVLDHGFVPYPRSKMGRGILYVHGQLPNGGGTVLFTTTHLESFNGRDDPGGPERARQCRELRDFCERQSVASIVTGDMNWDDYLAPRSRRKLQDVDKMQSIFDETKQGWSDTWLDLHGSNIDRNPGFTYDPKVNPMLGGGNLRRRFDRCIVRGNLECTGAIMLGTEAIGDLTFDKYNPFTHQTTTRKLAPSDHFGYVVTLETDSE